MVYWPGQNYGEALRERERERESRAYKVLRSEESMISLEETVRRDKAEEESQREAQSKREKLRMILEKLTRLATTKELKKYAACESSYVFHDYESSIMTYEDKCRIFDMEKVNDEYNIKICKRCGKRNIFLQI